MVRKMILLAVLIVLVLGCKKKTEDASGGGGGDDGKTDSDPNAAYTIKFGDERAGERTEQTATESGTSTVGGGGKSESQKQDKKLEFTEHVIDMPAGAAKPTKLTRTYTVAQKYDKAANATKALPFEGKTVAIEKQGAVYEFTADGKRLNATEAAEFSREFASQSKNRDTDLLPKKAVKVGESWAVDLAALKTLGSNMPFPTDATRSKVTAKLTRAYTKDGKQWGVVAVDFDLVVDSAAGGKAKAGQSVTGTIKATVTIDCVIDGSARDGTTTTNIKVDVTGKEGGQEVKVVADLVKTKAIRTLK